MHGVWEYLVRVCLSVCGRMCARPGNKRYGIPSVVFQLYGAVHMEFKIPPSVFYPVPKVRRKAMHTAMHT